MASHPNKEMRLIWIDLEMTGLDTDNDSILEIATIVTDAQLDVLAEGPELAIAHSVERLEAMDDWNRTQHRKSGLWQRVVEQGVGMAEAEQRTLDFLAQPAPDVVVYELADVAVRLGVRCHVRNADWFATKCDLNERIKKVFDATGISIQAAQRDIRAVRDITDGDNITFRIGQPSPPAQGE